MKLNLKRLAVSILIPLIIGGASALITRTGMDSFNRINKPPLSPPAIAFPIVWTILFILMGIASYFVANSKKPNGTALFFYGLQLIFNFFWSIIFFNLEAYLFAFIWLVILWALILITTVLFYKISKPAGLLMLPYLAWVTFAGYLNYAIYLLN